MAAAFDCDRGRAAARGKGRLAAAGGRVPPLHRPHDARRPGPGSRAAHAHLQALASVCRLPLAILWMGLTLSMSILGGLEQGWSFACRSLMAGALLYPALSLGTSRRRTAR